MLNPQRMTDLDVRCAVSILVIALTFATFFFLPADRDLKVFGMGVVTLIVGYWLNGGKNGNSPPPSPTP